MFKDGTADFISDLNRFRITRRALRSENMRTASIVLRDGSIMPISEFEVIGNVNPIWKFEFFDPVIDVALRLGASTGSMTVNEVKALVRKNKWWLGLTKDAPVTMREISMMDDIWDIFQALNRVQ